MATWWTSRENYEILVSLKDSAILDLRGNPVSWGYALNFEHAWMSLHEYDLRVLLTFIFWKFPPCSITASLVRLLFHSIHHQDPRRRTKSSFTFHLLIAFACKNSMQLGVIYYLNKMHLNRKFFWLCFRWMYWRQTWRVQNGRFWKIWSSKEFWIQWDSCCWSFTCTGQALRWVAMSHLWCGTGIACWRSLSAPASTSSTSTAILLNLTFFYRRMCLMPAVLTPWAGWILSGSL